MGPDETRGLIVTVEYRSFGMDLPILNLPNDAPWEMVEMYIRGMAPTS